MMEVLILPIGGISVAGGTQSRVALSESVVAEYADAMRAGEKLPPVVVFNDGASDGLWLADGFHRFHAHRAAGVCEIHCDVRVGTQRDAILFSAGANAAHGLRRTNEDKRHAVMLLLGDSEWSKWSDAAIARACAVSDKTVAAHRASYLRNSEDTEKSKGDVAVVRIVERGGSTYEQNTSNIRKPKSVSSAPVPVVPTTSQSEPISIATSEVEALREQVEELAESLRTTLADNEMMGRVFDADDRLKAAMDEAARQKAIATNAERTLAAKSGEFIERAKSVLYWQRRAEKAEKQLASLGATV